MHLQAKDERGGWVLINSASCFHRGAHKPVTTAFIQRQFDKLLFFLSGEIHSQENNDLDWKMELLQLRRQVDFIVFIFLKMCLDNKRGCIFRNMITSSYIFFILYFFVLCNLNKTKLKRCLLTSVRLCSLGFFVPLQFYANGKKHPITIRGNCATWQSDQIVGRRSRTHANTSKKHPKFTNQRLEEADLDAAEFFCEKYFEPKLEKQAHHS